MTEVSAGPVQGNAVVAYYTQAGPDYWAWSARGNMHFGFWRAGMNPLNLEAMLEQMNCEVIGRLALAPTRPARLLDMGCGLGATARTATTMLPRARVWGLSLAAGQLGTARRLTNAQDRPRRIAFATADYLATPFGPGSFDGVYAVESSCYAPGLAKAPLVREIHRVLRPGGRFVIADAFLKTTRAMGPFTALCYRTLCDFWALETWGYIEEFRAELARAGFVDLRIEEISRAVTPSVLHVPKTMLRFALSELPKLGRIGARRWGNLMAGLPLMAFALDRQRSGYFMVSGAKPRPARRPVTRRNAG
jgi:SAM-dependent methyltransferase